MKRSILKDTLGVMYKLDLGPNCYSCTIESSPSSPSPFLPPRGLLLEAKQAFPSLTILMENCIR